MSGIITRKERGRFWKKVDFLGTFVPYMNTRCWNWKAGTRGENEYGEFWLHGESWQAHRVAWLILKGPIPENTWVLHHCDNKLCINSEHLFLGNHQDNMKDAYKKGRLWINGKNGRGSVR